MAGIDLLPRGKSLSSEFDAVELAQVLANSDIVRFMATFNGPPAEMRALVRDRWLCPPTSALKLRRMADSWATADMGVGAVDRTAQDVLHKAADELDQLWKKSVRRPVSELRQEAFERGRPSGPDRWVVAWAQSAGEWLCYVARRVEGNGWQGEFGRLTSTPTHFSEVPVDVE